MADQAKDDDVRVRLVEGITETDTKTETVRATSLGLEMRGEEDEGKEHKAIRTGSRYFIYIHTVSRQTVQRLDGF